MPFTRSKLDNIANQILELMFSGTYGTKEYMNSACIAVTSDGENLYVAANDAYSDKKWSSDIIDQAEGILSKPDAQRPYLWKKKKYRFVLAKSQTFWNQFDVVSSLIGEVYSIAPSKILFIPNRKGDLDRSFHAEMQLIRYHEISETPMIPKYIGVSKPCCVDCTRVLLNANILFKSSHASSRSADWVDPGTYLDPASQNFPFLSSQT